VTWEYCLSALQREVATLMDASGLPSVAAVPHLVGARWLVTNDRPPYYVWVPVRVRGSQPTVVRQVEEHRTLIAGRHQVDVYCAGLTLDQASALAQNLVKAAQLAGTIDIAMENARWLDAGAAFNQDGETLIVELELSAPFIDAWVDVSTLADPVVTTVDPTGMVAELYSSDTGTTDDELLLVVDYEEPPPP
jgi:hypothetical protein